MSSFYVVFYTPALVPVGHGPLSTVSSVEISRQIDAPEEITISLSSLDPILSTFSPDRCRVSMKATHSDQSTPVSPFSYAVIESSEFSFEDRTWTLQCRGRISLLNDVNTLVNRSFEDADLDDVLTELVGLGSGFFFDYLDTGLDTLPITIRLDGVPVLDAITEVLKLHGLHWFVDDLTIWVTSFETLHDSYFFSLENFSDAPGGSWSGPRRHRVIASMTETRDLEDLVTRIYPQGKGTKDKALTLKRSTLSSPYTIASTTGPDGKLQYYIQDAAAVTAYGTISKVVQFSSITALDSTKQAQIDAANQLYYAASEYLIAHKQVVSRAEITCLNPNPDSTSGIGPVVPGYLHYLRFRERVDWITPGFPNGENYYTRILDMTYRCVGLTETYNDDGYVVTFSLVDQNVASSSTASQLVSQIQSLQTDASLPDLDPRLTATLSTTDASTVTLVSITPTIDSTFLIDGVVAGRRDNYNIGLNCRFAATVSRNSAGTTRIHGSFVNVAEDSGVTPTVTLDVDGSNNFRIRVTSNAVQNWDWVAMYSVALV